jgi:hypothetical protein
MSLLTIRGGQGAGKFVALTIVIRQNLGHISQLFEPVRLSQIDEPSHQAIRSARQTTGVAGFCPHGLLTNGGHAAFDKQYQSILAVRH